MKSDERDESAHKSLQLRDHSPSPGEGTIPKEWEPGRRVFMTIYQCGHISDPEERPTMPTASIVPVYYLAACDERCHARISLVLAGGITENVEARCLFATPGAAYDFLSKQFITDSEEITKEKKKE